MNKTDGAVAAGNENSCWALPGTDDESKCLTLHQLGSSGALFGPFSGV